MPICDHEEYLFSILTPRRVAVVGFPATAPNNTPSRQDCISVPALLCDSESSRPHPSPKLVPPVYNQPVYLNSFNNRYEHETTHSNQS
ncbi:hypothetical protein AVEN_256871-1 [Araneus ventricosus]|uniref:Uncharacterized protein n=1 Tax=Araneus ventricosus TaxID=182803 RepID=A0A4Y2T4N1_ARAVE|nr:hypothetical protein AVEN_256871-1 [Araneus ventricosus]